MVPLTNSLKHAAACRSMPQRAKIFLGTVGACEPKFSWGPLVLARAQGCGGHLPWAPAVLEGPVDIFLEYFHSNVTGSELTSRMQIILTLVAIMPASIVTHDKGGQYPPYLCPIVLTRFSMWTTYMASLNLEAMTVAWWSPVG